MKNLVIVESPTKARTIGRFLGSDYEVIASMGHIYDLPKSTLGVDVENNFEPQYELMKTKEKTLSQLKSASKKADNIILATDLDREGEAIAYHITQNLGIKNAKRIVFHEITNEAINEALNNPKTINENLVDAQTARRVLDRLVGYKLSPILWSKVRRGLSAGRVQSVALRLIVEREREIERFKKEPYFTITTNLKSEKSGKEGTEFELIEIKGEKIEETKKMVLYDGEYKYVVTSISTEEKAKEIEKDLSGKDFIIRSVNQREIRRTPPPPYTTSTLQQDGARRMGLSGKRTMSLAQKLYEEGYITYHRTDSHQISDAAKKQMSDYVKKEYGQKYISDKPRVYKTTSKNAQEAHEAIRPAKVQVSQSKVSQDLGAQYAKLYELIWRRAVATTMADAITESTVINVDGGKGSYTLKANGSVLLFEGFLKVNPYALNDKRLPDYKEGEKLNYVTSVTQPHETLPPPRYNDASIIKTLEEKGIGRPSTYATIISTIESRGYIEREEARFKPNPVGITVNDFLVENFGTVDDIPFTAQMEDQLDDVANGTKKWIPVMKEFYEPFEKTLEKVKDAKRVKIETEKTGEKCPTCKKGDVVIRSGRFGKFKSCSTFPECKYTAPFTEETDLICPRDGGKIIIKKTKKGRKFYGCGNYPNCDFAAWRVDQIKKETELKKEENK